METVTVTREVDAAPAAIRAAVADVEAFTAAGGFDEVTVDGDVVDIENRVGLATMSLTLERVDSDAALALRQRDGHFAEMRTRYEVEPVGEDGAGEAGPCLVTATTDFELGTAVVGDLLDATLIRRQRTKELEGQMDYLEETVV